MKPSQHRYLVILGMITQFCYQYLFPIFEVGGIFTTIETSCSSCYMRFIRIQLELIIFGELQKKIYYFESKLNRCDFENTSQMIASITTYVVILMQFDPLFSKEITDNDVTMILNETARNAITSNN